MQFTIYGLIDDREVQVTWNAGRLSGDADTVDEVAALADVMEGKAVGPEPDGPFTHKRHLKNPLSALILIEDVLDEVITRRGELPQRTAAEHAA